MTKQNNKRQRSNLHWIWTKLNSFQHLSPNSGLKYATQAAHEKTKRSPSHHPPTSRMIPRDPSYTQWISRDFNLIIDLDPLTQKAICLNICFLSTSGDLCKLTYCVHKCNCSCNKPMIINIKLENILCLTMGENLKRDSPSCSPTLSLDQVSLKS